MITQAVDKGSIFLLKFYIQKQKKGLLLKAALYV